MNSIKTDEARQSTRVISAGMAGLSPFEEALSLSVTGQLAYGDDDRSVCHGSGSDYSAIISRAGLCAELMSLPFRYAEEGWDGYEAAPLSTESFSSAVSFLGKMPLGFPVPRVVVDPDGDICFKWEKSRNDRVELTFSKRGSYYALIVMRGMRTLLGSTSCDEMAKNAERVLGWRQ